MSDQTTPQDPRTQHPDADAQTAEQIPHPGLTDQMSHEPDHGEQSYRGAERLQDKRAIITAPTPASAARWRWPSRARAPTW